MIMVLAHFLKAGGITRQDDRLAIEVMTTTVLVTVKKGLPGERSDLCSETKQTLPQVDSILREGNVLPRERAVLQDARHRLAMALIK